MTKTIAEINEKIRKGKAVVVTAEEVIILDRPHTPEQASEYFPHLLQELGVILRFLQEDKG